jgi:hypothetical protein
MMHTLLSSTEIRLDQKLDQIKEMTSSTNTIHSTLNQLVTKFENSSIKGRISENILYGILQNLYPSADVSYVGKTAESGDMIMNRKNRKPILFENKNYEATVNKDEVSKFYRDIQSSSIKYNGIFISQKSGIAGKENFEIELHDNKNVLVFLHNVNYDSNIIKVAVEIVDHFYETICELGEDTDQDTKIHIEKTVLDEIHGEFKLFATKKLNYLGIIRECNQKLMSGLEDIKMPCLEGFLNRHYLNSLVSKDFTCACGYAAKNQRSLKNHMRYCKPDSASAAVEVAIDQELTQEQPKTSKKKLKTSASNPIDNGSSETENG